MIQRRVIPKEGRRVRDPNTRAVIPAEGRVVDWSLYWDRQLKRGDIEVAGVTEQPEKIIAAVTAEE